MSKGFFVTGTDTGIGKTVITAGIVRWLRGQGVDAVPMKPVQTGAERKGGRLVSPDLEFCLAASNLIPSPGENELMAPYIYEPACSPHLAGRLAGKYPEIPEIKRCADKLLQTHQIIIVEGAGGIIVPLNERQTMLDLMAALNYPVILVARFGLGTINHTLLSIRALREAGLTVLGVVFNRTELSRPEKRFIEEDNPDAIVRFGDVPVLGKLEYLENLNSADKKVWQSYETNMPGLELILGRRLT